MALLSCFALLGLCFFLMRVSSLSIEQTPFIVVSTVITALYIFAYAGYLSLGVYLLLLFGCAGCLYFWFELYTRTQEVIEGFFSPGFVVWLLAFAVVACVTSTYSFSSWDEFMHWGILSKNMYYHAGFQLSGDAIVHQSYPPGGRLLHYFFFCLPGFSEGRAYVAQMLILMSPLALLVKGFSWKDWHKPLLVILLALLVMIYFQTAILTKATILMDAPISVFFGLGLVFYFQEKKKQHAILWLIPVIFSLMLFKSQIFPLAFLFISVLFIDVLIKKHYRALFSLFLLFCAVVVSYASWSHYLKLVSVSTEWSLHFTVSSILSSFSAAAPLHSKLAICHYFQRFDTLYPTISLLILLSCLFASTIKNMRDMVSWLVANAMLTLGFYAYGFGLLLMYIFAFVGFKGEELTSFDRYIGIYLLGWSLFVFYGGVQVLANLKNKYWRYAQYCVLVLALATLIFVSLARYCHYQRVVDSGRSVAYLRSEIRKITDAVSFIVPAGSKIFLVWQNSRGAEAKIAAYELFPLSANSLATSFGPRYSMGQVSAKNYSPKIFATKLLGRDYLLLARPDEQFFKVYGQLLPANIKPLVTYNLCLGEGFDPVRAHGCVLTKQQSYLFKIEQDDNSVKLMNVS